MVLLDFAGQSCFRKPRDCLCFKFDQIGDNHVSEVGGMFFSEVRNVRKERETGLIILHLPRCLLLPVQGSIDTAPSIVLYISRKECYLAAVGTQHDVEEPTACGRC